MAAVRFSPMSDGMPTTHITLSETTSAADIPEGWFTLESVLEVLGVVFIILLISYLVGPFRKRRSRIVPILPTNSQPMTLSAETASLAKRLAAVQGRSTEDVIRLALEEKEDEEEEGLPGESVAGLKKIAHSKAHLFFWGGIVCVLAGAGLGKMGPNYFVPAREMAATVVGELGFALLIAYFISTGVESIAREQHNKNVLKQIKRIKRDVFEAIYKKDHDPKLIDFIDSNIFRHPFYRTNFSLRIRITYADNHNYYAVPGPEDPVYVYVTSRHSVKNVSTVDHEYPIHVFVEKPYRQDLKQGVGLRSLIINNVPLTDAELRDALVEETDDFLRYERIIQIGKKETASIQSDLCCVKFARDEMPWRSHDTCNGLYLSVEHPPGLKPDAFPIHRNTKVRPQHNAGAQLELSIEEPLFPHNGVTVWWAPQSLPSASQPPSPHPVAKPTVIPDVLSGASPSPDTSYQDTS
jgi:hypothetical protein